MLQETILKADMNMKPIGVEENVCYRDVLLLIYGPKKVWKEQCNSKSATGRENLWVFFC